MNSRLVGFAGSIRFLALATLVIVGLLTIIASASAPKLEPLKAYEGDERPDSEVATLKFASKSIIWMEIDGKRLEDPARELFYNEAKVLPGTHDIRWLAGWGFSFLVNPRMYGEFENSARINLEPGHIYTLHAKRTYGYGYRVFMWIRDEATTQVVAGTPKN